MKWYQTISYSLRTFSRQSSLPAIRLLVLSVILAVATVTMIGVVSEMLARSLADSSTKFMAGDRQVVSPRAIDQSWLDKASELELKLSRSIEFSSMLSSGDDLQLVRVKGVDQSYPLKGSLLVNSDAGQRIEAETGPRDGDIWLQPRLFALFGLNAGDVASIGDKSFTVTSELVQEPDSGFQMGGIAPKVLIDINDIEATGVIQPGSRIVYRYYFVGEESKLEVFDDWINPKLDSAQRLEGVREGRPAIADALAKTDSYLLLGGSLAVLLACVAIAMASRQFSLSQIDNVAIMKSIGLSSNRILFHYIVQLGAVALLASALGIFVGLLFAFSIQSVLSNLIEDLLPPSLSMVSGRVLLLAFGTASLSLFSFALPQFMQLRSVSPMRVLREEKDAAIAWSWSSTVIGLSGAFALLFVYSGDIALVGALVAGVIAVILVLTLIGSLIYFLIGRRLPKGVQVGSTFIQAVNRLMRRPWHSLIQLNVFSLALFLFTVIFLAREALIGDWQQQLPDDAPNHFLINIADSDLEAIQSTLSENNLTDSGLYPLVRGRLSHINDVEVKVAVTKDVAALNRELNLTWADELPKDNVVEDGFWWKEGEVFNRLDSPELADLPMVSVESQLADRLGLSVGDKLTFAISGQDLHSVVTSIRSVQWDNLQPNFYMLFEPEALNTFASTYITAFHLPVEQKSFLNELSKEFPTVTILELDHIVEKIQTIVGQVSSMIELILVFILGASLLVISALISNTMGERSREAALLRTLGAPSKTISLTQFVEFSLLGVLSGIVAVIAGEAVIWILQTEVLESTFRFHYEVWLTVPLVSAIVIGCVSYIQIRKIPNTSPMVVLREL